MYIKWCQWCQVCKGCGGGCGYGGCGGFCGNCCCCCFCCSWLKENGVWRKNGCMVRGVGLGREGGIGDENLFFFFERVNEFSE